MNSAHVLTATAPNVDDSSINITIKLDGHNCFSVDRRIRESYGIGTTVNWSAWGSQSVETAAAFGRAMIATVAIAKHIESLDADAIAAAYDSENWDEVRRMESALVVDVNAILLPFNA